MEFDGFRIALLLIGVLIVVGVYFWDRIGKRNANGDKTRREPALTPDGFSTSSTSSAGARREPVIDLGHSPHPMDSATDQRNAESDPIKMDFDVDEVPVLYDEIFKTPKPGEPSDVIVVNVFSKTGQRFEGVALDAALQASGMEYGAMRIYHRMDDSGDRLFSLVNSVEPGYFEPESYADFSTPGISMFLALPGPQRPDAAFEELIATAESLTQNLDGRLLDQDHNPLRTQGIEHLRERVREFERRQRIASAKA